MHFCVDVYFWWIVAVVLWPDLCVQHFCLLLWHVAGFLLVHELNDKPLGFMSAQGCEVCGCACVSRGGLRGRGSTQSCHYKDSMAWGVKESMCACTYVCNACVGSMCEASVAQFVCMCVFVCVPCGSRGQAEGIRLTDVTVSLYTGIQTRRIHLVTISPNVSILANN